MLPALLTGAPPPALGSLYCNPHRFPHCSPYRRGDILASLREVDEQEDINKVWGELPAPGGALVPCSTPPGRACS